MAQDAPAPASGAPPIDYNAIIQQIMQGGGAIQGPAAPATPAVNTNLPVASLLGEALGGGVSPLYPMSEAQQTQAGNAALLNFGINMLQNSSGPVRHSLGQAIASGLLGAQGSLAGVREGQAQTLDVQNKQQEMHLKLLEAAMPFLRMQQAAGMPNPLDSSAKAPGGGIGATGAPIATGSGVAPADMVGSIASTLNIPTADAAAIASNFHAESGLIPGINEIKPAPGTRGGYGLAQWTDTQGSPRRTDLEAYATANKLNVADPATQLAFMKQEIAQNYPNLLPQMAAAKTPEEKAAIFYNTYEGGPPRLLGAHTAMAAPFAALPPPGSAPGGSRTATAPPAPTTPPAPVARPAAAPVAPAGTIQGTPDTGGTQVGGPGALPGVIRPPGPLVPSDVKAMIGGMTGAGANAATLAPGGGTAAPTAPTIAQAAPPTVTPPAQPTQADQPPPIGGQTWEQFLTQHMPQPTPEETATWHQAPNPARLAEAAAERARAAQDLSAARANFGAGSKEANLAGTAFQAASKAQADLEREYSQTNATTLLDWTNKQKTLLAPLFKNQQDQAQAVAENEKNRQAENARLTQAGQQAIALEQARGRTADESKVMDSLNETRESARTAIDQLGLARSLSQQAGDPTFWQTVQQSHPQLVQALANMGALNNDQVTQLGYAGASDAAMNKLISMARTGSGFQRMTNLDVQILSSQAPKAVDPQAWRDAKMDYLQTYMARQMQYVDNVRSLRADGTPLYEAQKRAAADTGDIVPQIPNFTDTPQKSAVQQRIEWAQDRLSPNTFFRAPDGKLVIYRGPQAQTEQQTTAPAPTKSLVPVN